MNKPFYLGLFYIATLTFIAYVLGDLVAGLSNIIWALLLGLVAGNLFNLNKRIPKALVFGEKQLLAGAIILLGFQLDVMVIQNYIWMLPILIVMIILSMMLGIKLAPRFGIDKECGLLLGAGNAICGTSAIATLAPVINAKNYQTAVSISVIHVLGTVALLAIPVIIPVLPIEDESWGIITGGTFQAVGQAIGAGYTVSLSAGEVATIIKLTRVLMLAPVVLFFTLKNKKESKSSSKVKFPLFIYGFIGAIIVGNFINELPFVSTISSIQEILLVAAMVAIGSKIFYKDLLVSGPKAFKLGLFIFIFQIGFISMFIWVKQILFQS
jgi:uncharacterized integral membrane protein (TIGR00698 family)